MSRLGPSAHVAAMSTQLVLERAADEGIDPVKLTFQFSASVTEIELPTGLVDPGDALKVEVLVKETSSGNQTATESCFVIVAG